MDMRTVGGKVHSHSSNCIYSIANLMGTLLSSLCQMLNKETVGLIPVIRLWLLISGVLILTNPLSPVTIKPSWRKAPRDSSWQVKSSQ